MGSKPVFGFGFGFSNKIRPKKNPSYYKKKKLQVFINGVIIV
jgi:hypothetical protein